MKKKIQIIILLLMGLTAMYKLVYDKGYLAGSWDAYADGWSDAHCGNGNDCEAGQQ